MRGLVTQFRLWLAAVLIGRSQLDGEYAYWLARHVLAMANSGEAFEITGTEALRRIVRRADAACGRRRGG